MPKKEKNDNDEIIKMYKEIFECGSQNAKWNIGTFITMNYKKGHEKELLKQVMKMCDLLSEKYIDEMFGDK